MGMNDKIAVEEDILQLVSFQLLDEPFAINVAYVQEIIRIQAITDVPHAAGHILGVINLRGQIIPVIDLKVKFGLERNENTGATRIVVVNVNSTVVGMVVDSVSEVIRLDSGSVEPPSPVISSIDSDYLQGVGKQGEKMIMLLDIEKILSAGGVTPTVSELESNISGLLED